MSSAMKRKRATAENAGTPKRARSTKTQPAVPASKLNDVSGWDAAFNPPAPEASTTNEAPESSKKTVKSASPDAVNFEDFVATPELESSKKGKKARKLAAVEVKKTVQFTAEDGATGGELVQETNGTDKSLTPKTPKKKNADMWKISEPIGGRLINMDPVFAADEKHLIVASRAALHVYSTSNSLLIRSIKIKVNAAAIPATRIVAYALSPNHADIIWVACSDATVYRVDWTNGGGAERSWGVSSQACIHMTVASMESAGRRRDVVFTTEVRKEGGFRITANELATPDTGIANAARTIYTSTECISLLKTGSNGSVVIASSGNRILVGNLRSTDYNTIDKIRYEFRVFESSSPIKSLDVRAYDRPKDMIVESVGKDSAPKPSRKARLPVVDVVVGDIKGLVFVHTDLLLKLFHDNKSLGLSPVPRKLHWHRQCVHTVKWSLDGNYIISGGAESVLVLWQLDTGKQQFLPHLSATVQNVVVSPTGSSYAIQLADNSAMVVSTAELRPTANISGIQLSVVEPEAPIESQIQMIEDASWLKPLVQRVPAVINPAHPSSLLLGVGQVQTIKPQKPQKMSNPYLETFDLSAGHNISHQALTRTNVTSINAAPMPFKMTEPRVTHIKISSDGQWLATADEWTPPSQEFEHLKHKNKALVEEQRRRREVFLKFWQWSKKNSTWELVSRINAPHSAGENSVDAGRIFDIAVDPSSLRFSTIGEDGVVRNWTPKTRKRDGIVVRDQDSRPLRNWVCENAILLSKLELLDTKNRNDIPRTGLLAFSDDGSLLAAACSSEDGIVYLINPETGAIRTSHIGLFESEIYGLQILGQDLIILSDHLTVFDLVSQELRYGIKLHDSLARLSIEQKQEMMHLAIDEQSQTFAVSLPQFSVPTSGPQTLWEASSELFVFAQDTPTPQYKYAFSSVVSAVIPSVSTPGYIILDTSAEIYTVGKKGAKSIHLAQSASALQLDEVPEEAAADLMQLVEVQDIDVDDEENSLPTPDDTQVEHEDDDDFEAAVVSREQLSNIFDIGPAFALPPMEEMFYQVAGLFTAKPLVQSSA